MANTSLLRRTDSARMNTEYESYCSEEFRTYGEDMPARLPSEPDPVPDHDGFMSGTFGKRHRPRRCAAARRAQKNRSDARMITRLLSGLIDLDTHRGCRPRPICRHFLLNCCTWGDKCRFAHDHRNDCPAQRNGGNESAPTYDTGYCGQGNYSEHSDSAHASEPNMYYVDGAYEDFEPDASGEHNSGYGDSDFDPACVDDVAVAQANCKQTVMLLAEFEKLANCHSNDIKPTADHGPIDDIDEIIEIIGSLPEGDRPDAFNILPHMLRSEVSVRMTDSSSLYNDVRHACVANADNLNTLRQKCDDLDRTIYENFCQLMKCHNHNKRLVRSAFDPTAFAELIDTHRVAGRGRTDKVTNPSIKGAYGLTISVGSRTDHGDATSSVSLISQRMLSLVIDTLDITPHGQRVHAVKSLPTDTISALYGTHYSFSDGSALADIMKEISCDSNAVEQTSSDDETSNCDGDRE